MKTVESVAGHGGHHYDPRRPSLPPWLWHCAREPFHLLTIKVLSIEEINIIVF